MSVFKRLSNVARGKLKEIGRNLNELDPFGADAPPDGPDAPPPGRSGDARRATLLRMRDEGLLTEAELQERLGLLEQSSGAASPERPTENGSKPTPPASGQPKKRTL